MIDLFESTARTYPDQVFFAFIDAEGVETTYTYRQARLVSAALARKLKTGGVNPGDAVVVDLPNCPEFVFVLLAAAYGSFAVVTLNQRLSVSEKLTRLLDLERNGVRPVCTIDEQSKESIIGRVRALQNNNADIVSSVYGAVRGSGVVMSAKQDAVEDTVHFAEREAHLFDFDAQAVIMFTSGTTGKSKAVPLTWRQLVSASYVSNLSISQPNTGVWQAVLPFFHIGGLQVLVRSVANGTPLRIYERFDARKVLQDAEARRITHISVVDKMLQDLLAENAQKTTIYQCILLGGAALNPSTVQRALEVGANVFASYGMTETSSHVANARITPQFTGGLQLMQGYSARIVDPDPQGFGRLALCGPGVFSGYINARAAFTVDGCFLTGDVAAIHEGLLYVKERTSDMFVSGGENIYPAEIARALCQVDGVADAHVFGVPHETWGRRPVAVVARKREGVVARDVYEGIKPLLSKLNTPDDIMVIDELPRKGIGKLDRQAIEQLYEQRIDVKEVIFHHIRLPFRKPFRTAQVTLTHRDLIVVEVVDHAGRVGLGECASFQTDWYLPETLGDDALFMKYKLAPVLQERTFVHPREVSRAFEAVPGSDQLTMAQSALEMAVWDLYGKIRNKPLWALLNEEYERLWLEEVGVKPPALHKNAAVRGASALVPAGVVVGIDSPEQTVAAAREAEHEGYRRLKLKISPDQGIESLAAVRKEFPQLLITLDANQSFSDYDFAKLTEVDTLGAGWIEEPLTVRYSHYGGREDLLARLARLQVKLQTPICVDESYVNAQEAENVLKYRNLRCIAVKVGKFGGIQQALRFVVLAQHAGRELWMGGMYDTGISKRVHAAFETLPGIVIPGDVGTTARYFETEVTTPPYVAKRGYMLLNGEGHTAGIGCALDIAAVDSVLIRRVSV